MSGEELRTAAMKGDHEKIKEYIIERANTCSVDEFGLTSLHYAVWNGHIECVKLLVSNSWGVSITGQKCRGINFQTSMGFTALHLAAMDTPKARAKEVALLLLITGCDEAIASEKGQKAFDIATENKNTEVLSAFEEFHEAKTNKTIKAKLQGMVNILKSEYLFQVNTKTRGTVDVTEIKQHFQVPHFLLEEQELYGNIPNGMTIHEHQIKPLTNTGFHNMSGSESLQCLQFSREQAFLNIQRREHLVRESNKSFISTDTERIMGSRTV